MKVYAVIEDYINSYTLVNNFYVEVFATYEKAKEYFNEVRQQIIEYELGFNECEDKEDYYCEYESGEYQYNHSSVEILEREVK